MREIIEAATLECAREPIHLLGRIQNFGCLIAVGPKNRSVLQVSTNVGDILSGFSPSDLLNRPVDELFRWTGEFEPSRDSKRSGLKVIEKGDELFLCRHFVNPEGIWIWEIEPKPAARDDVWIEEGRAASEAFSALHETADLTALGDALASEVHRITGFERVLIYRFDAEWNGEVVAEALTLGDSYRNQRFPASDIPPQAREQFLSNWIRMIPDVDAPAYTLEPETHPHTRAVLNMSRSQLRHPSLIHLEYLRNMKVGASLTLSLIREGKLWGLVACHHTTPKKITAFQFETCEMLAQLASSLLGVKEDHQDADYRRVLSEVHRQLVEYMQNTDDSAAGLTRYRPNLLDLAQARGAAAAIYIDGRWSVIGKIPNLDQISALMFWLRHNHAGKDWFATDNLPGEYAPANQFKEIASGLLAISIPKTELSYVMWFRPEVLRTLEWAGNPNKPIVQEAGETKIHPRKSFELWKETVSGKSMPWKAAEIEAALKLRKSIIERDLERQFQREKKARAETEAEKKRFAYISEASASLSRLLEENAILKEVGALSVSAMAEWAILRKRSLDGKWSEPLVFHRNEPGTRIVREIFGTRDSFSDATPVLDALVRREPIFEPRVRDLFFERWIPNPQMAERLRTLMGIRSFIAVLITNVAGDVIGAMEWGISNEFRYFSEKDVELAEQLVLRARSALENARLYQEAERAVLEREEVIGVVSHDLKNPLTAIALNAQMIERAAAKGNLALATDPASKIVGTCRRMRKLIDDLLSVSKIHAGKMGLELREISAHQVLRESHEMHLPLANDKRIQLVLREGKTNCILRCEPDRVQQVFSNLVGNAVKFTPAEGVVTISLDECGEFAKFTVKDSGPGIPKQDLVNIFDRYWQARKTAKQGSGLGLAIAKGIVEAHGGKIWAESEDKKGTSVSFTIPTASTPTPLTDENLPTRDKNERAVDEKNAD